MRPETSRSLRDYSAISPSALALLLMKSQTSIAFAKEATSLIWGDAAPGELAHMMMTEGAARRLRHFESRYRSIDALLKRTGTKHVLELGSGLSFRGLEMARDKETFYVDTDLPRIAAMKADLVTRLHPAPLAGTLRVRPLDALDTNAFRESVAEFPGGPIAIVNEGLLVYLGPEEKARLAANIREALDDRGGFWVTADVYVKNPPGVASIFVDAQARRFLADHRVEENKFGGWDAAESFFAEHGFSIAARLAPEDPRHARESWMLSVTP